MATSITPDVARARFAVFVERALDNARARGMTDREIQRVSGVATSTFHRWRLGEGATLPKLDRVRAFCQATGASIEDAMRALGMTDSSPAPTPEPPLPPEIRTILRQLADPNVSESDKLVIREMLKLLAQQARRESPPRESAG